MAAGFPKVEFTDRHGPGLAEYRNEATGRLTSSYRRYRGMDEREAAEQAARQVEELIARAAGDATRIADIFVEGACCGVIAFTWDIEGGYLFIWDIFVNDDARRKGYGSTAMVLVEAIAASYGIDEIRLSAECGNTVSEQFFRSAGFRCVSIVFHKRL